MNATTLVSNVSPWIAPAPVAYAVYEATHTQLSWPPLMAVVAAVIIETISLATIHTGLQLFTYNKSKRKADPAAPAWVAWAITAAVILAQSALILALEGRPVLLVFQVFSVAAVVNLALRADHDARLHEVSEARRERSEARRAERTHVAVLPAPPAPQLTQGHVEPAHRCDVCGATYAKQTSLAAHMRSHKRVEVA